jgi:hypothetical protein
MVSRILSGGNCNILVRDQRELRISNLFVDALVFMRPCGAVQNRYINQ